VTLVGRKSGREISARALLDSGAEGIIIDQDFAERNKFMLHNLQNPLPVKNVDGTFNKKGSVKYTTIQRIRIKTLDDQFHEETLGLYVTTLADHDIIFGTDWLHAHNPEVDWTLPQVAFTWCPAACTLSKKPLVITSKKAQTRATTINVIQPSSSAEESLEPDFALDALESFIYALSFAKYDNLAIRAKTTTSTGLAAQTASKASSAHIPAQFRQYTKIFNEEASRRLPQNQPWDHAIELIPGASMPRCGIYCLTPKELDALQDYVTEHV
jgi:hypothetical protein